MPQAYVQKLATKYGISLERAEHLWKKAKKVAAQEGQGEDYGYITGIFKRMMKEDVIQLPRFKSFLGEMARKNPEQNPKVSIVEALRQYKDDSDIYISFTDIDKIGINPQSQFNTPLGIYTYNLQTGWDMYSVDRLKSLKGFPFAADKPYVNVLKAKITDGFIEDMYSDYNSANFDKDEKIIEQIYFNEIEKAEPYYNTTQMKANNWVRVYKQALESAREKNPVVSFWNLTRLVSLELAGGHEGIKASTKWNRILRECGYTGFGDLSSRGYVHPSEPMQTVFLSRNAFEVLDRIPNKDFKQATSVFSLHDLLDAKDKKMLDMFNVLNIMGGYNTVPYKFGEVTMKVSPEELYANSEYEDVNRLLIEVYKHMVNFKKNPPPIPNQHLISGYKSAITQIWHKCINSRYFLNGEVSALMVWVDKIIDFPQ